MASLLSTVTDALGYENLGGGSYKQSTARITSIPSRDASARQPLGLPNGAVPGVKNPIPTSTARPGKQTNQRITYVRVQTQFHKECGHLDLVPVMEGDVVFVHRQDGTNSPGNAGMGGIGGADIARTSRIASITQLNVMLGSGNINTLGEVTMAPDKNPRGLDRMEWVAENAGKFNDIREAERQYDENPVWYRWSDCKSLARWTPDGVLASKEHDCVMDVSNPGEAFNVTIGGPTLTRNSAAGEHPQHFDDGVRVLDKLFVGLIASENREGKTASGANRYFSFKYKLFTARQLVWAPLGAQTLGVADLEAHAPGGDNIIGPTVDEFARMVDVWRIGSVLDSKAGMMPYKCATVNVVVEPWSLEMIQMEYNPYFGESLALAPGLYDNIITLIADATVIVNPANLKNLVDVRAALDSSTPGPIYNASLVSEVVQWEEIDKAHKEDVDLFTIRNPGKALPVGPGIAPGPTRQHGPVFGSRRYYEPPSQILKNFYDAYTTKAVFNQVKPLLNDQVSLNALGRAAALRGNKKLYSNLPQVERDRLDRIGQLHAKLMGVRAAMRLGKKLEDAYAAGKSWPQLV
tara:strand:- start:6223 stop:7953 length:1731 start_codon:yes stop_codon:yes gene_type:complete